MGVGTLTIARGLRSAEFSQPPAEAIAAAIGNSILESAATKSDLRELKLELEARIAGVQSTLIMWMVGSQLTLAAVMIAATKL